MSQCDITVTLPFRKKMSYEINKQIDHNENIENKEHQKTREKKCNST